ncbi:hypothetical protein Mal64_02540 [Pseudobythopirellula maris]|uniref:PKD domain-containing protein n=1 Tax=Pseudobythopirellula maris TaxID=2527991 RepID=A0A5C5ZQP3_9BACT|nr:PKD domain-containing protein [Pseudobythopirellula maris]TWT89872.1 hypothetical protein Mal64_02540 [Pseudobythopirellula maris]
MPSKPAAWFGRRVRPTRPPGDRADALVVRRLEPRRVLDATLTNVVVPNTALEGDTVEVSAEATGTGDLQFEWTILQAGVVIETSNDAAFRFTPIDDGIYRTRVVVTDSTGASDLVTDSVRVGNVAPALENVTADDIDENGVTTLSGDIVDPGLADSFTLTVDWGDGTVETFNYAAADRSFSETHQYLDDNPSGTQVDPVTIRLTVEDDDGGVGEASVAIEVSNLPPELADVSATDADENGVATLSGVIVDGGTLDTHTLRVDWGDGTVETFSYAAGERAFSETHQYLDDNPTGTATDPVVIRLLVLDDDLDRGLASTTINVANLPPTLQGIGATDVDENGSTTLTGVIVDPGSLDTFTLTVDWGDGSTETFLYSAAERAFSETHKYIDDNPSGTPVDSYTITLTVTDDDTGTDSASVMINTSNLPPVFDPIADPTVDEGAVFTLTPEVMGALAPIVSFTDPGTNDTHTATIDWGDGSAAEPLVVTESGGAGFLSGEHIYSDNGDYTATVTLTDDDGGVAVAALTVHVENVAPTLVLTDEPFTINEGETLDLTALGVFSDPAFDTETFSYTIDWGDGTQDAPRPPESTVNGSEGTPTTGALAASHFYTDNDTDEELLGETVKDNTYTVTVTLTDDDGGVTVETIEVTVLNVNPMLDPVAATDVGGDGKTTLTLTFEDPGADDFVVLVDWGDGAGFTPEETIAGPTPQTVVIEHTYTGPPDPLNPSADIVITVKVQDDDFGSTALQVGESNLESVAIKNSGIEDNTVVFVLATGGGPAELPQREVVALPPERVSDVDLESRSASEGAARSDASVASERYLELVVVYPDGTEGEGHRLKTESLDDLPALFRTLPENRYRVYVVRTENSSRRLVIDVYVRSGRLIDPSDDSDGARDRPPTSEVGESQLEQPSTPPADSPADEDPSQQPPEAAPIESIPFPAQGAEAAEGASEASAAPLVAAAALAPIAIDRSRANRAWAQRLDRALAGRDAKAQWARFRRVWRRANRQPRP